MTQNSQNSRELVKKNKEIERLRTTVEHVKSSKAVYVFESVVRRPNIRTSVTSHHPNRKVAREFMEEAYLQITGKKLATKDNFVRYVSDDETIVATFEIYKPRME